MNIRWIGILLTSMALLIFLAACSSVPTSTSTATSPGSITPLDGATLLQQRCSVCHPLTFVERSRHSAADWKLIVGLMASRGAQLSPGEEAVVVSYLAANFGQ